ncbi:MAG: septum formation initiator family protein [Verrucomicrobiota bacterium]|nr:septum formation initiator family protein [Verrucomicrobiota bacterium]
MQQQVDLGIWHKLTRLIILLLVVAALLAVAFWYLPLIQQNERMRKEIHNLEQQVKEEEKARRQLENAIRALRNDPKTLERTARERLGYARTGETIIYFEPVTTNSNSFPQP